MGCAAPGAVVVLGGAEKVRDPREPELPPPPTRASAFRDDNRQRERHGQDNRESPNNSARALREIHVFFLSPQDWGSAPNMGTDA
jgi:hypothetical protein